MSPLLVLAAQRRLVANQPIVSQPVVSQPVAKQPLLPVPQMRERPRPHRLTRVDDQLVKQDLLWS